MSRAHRSPRGRPARRAADHHRPYCRPSRSSPGSTPSTPPACARSRCRSFVPPKLLPQFADADDGRAARAAMPGLTVAALMPNLQRRRARRSRSACTRSITCCRSSEGHNLANVRRTTAESIADFTRIVDALRASSRRSGRQAVAGSPPRSAARSRATCRRGSGGRASPASSWRPAPTRSCSPTRSATAIRAAIAHGVRARAAGESRRFRSAAHFHDTRGLGLANVAAAVDAGVRAFDASLGGLGGCPYAPGATGNIVTEDCVFMLESMGFDTGIDLEKLIAVREHRRAGAAGRALYGAIAKAGLPKGFRLTRKPARRPEDRHEHREPDQGIDDAGFVRARRGLSRACATRCGASAPNFRANYWRALEDGSEYPTEFVNELTDRRLPRRR